MTFEEIEEAMDEYAEKSALLPFPENADQAREAWKFLAELPAQKAARCLAEKFSSNSATRLWNRGMLSPTEFYQKLLEDIETAWMITSM
jgi:hypothetical protein